MRLKPDKPGFAFGERVGHELTQKDTKKYKPRIESLRDKILPGRREV
jgi:hypothetical protein